MNNRTTYLKTINWIGSNVNQNFKLSKEKIQEIKDHNKKLGFEWDEKKQRYKPLRLV